MKRIVKLSFVLLLVVILSGCKKQVVTKCTLNNDESSNGFSIKSEYKIFSDDSGVNKVETEEVVESKNKQVLSYFEKQLKEQYKYMNETYNGYTINITNKDGKVVSKIKVDYNKMNLDKYTSENPALKDYINKNGKITLDGMKKMYSSLGATCNK